MKDRNLLMLVEVHIIFSVLNIAYYSIIGYDMIENIILAIEYLSILLIIAREV